MEPEVQKLISRPVKGTLKEVKKMIDDIKMVAMAILGDNKVLNKSPTIEHPLMPLDEEIDQTLSEAAVLRDIMRDRLERLKELDPEAPELKNEFIQKIVAE